MTDHERQRMNVRAIRVTLGSALRYASPDQAEQCRVRAQQLLEHARSEASDPALVSEIEGLQAELRGEGTGERLSDG